MRTRLIASYVILLTVWTFRSDAKTAYCWNTGNESYQTVYTKSIPQTLWADVRAYGESRLDTEVGLIVKDYENHYTFDHAGVPSSAVRNPGGDVVLGIDIATSDNSEFFALPNWIPESVSVTKTPGSASFVPHGSITTNDAAALYAVFNGYCERCYYFSQGARDIWDMSIYGDTTSRGFTFGGIRGGANFGDRTADPGRGIVGLARMTAVANNLDFARYYCYRPPYWDFDKFAISSGILKYESNGDRVPLDDASYAPSFSWKDTPDFGGRWPNATFLGLRNYNPAGDGVFNSGSRKKSICADALDEIDFGQHPSYWSGSEDGMTNIVTTYQDAITNAYGRIDVSRVRHPTNTLESVQPWMSAADVMLASMDRVYTAVRVPAAMTNIYDHWSNVKTGICHKGEHLFTIETAGEKASCEKIDVERSDWFVGGYLTNDVHEIGTGALHSRELKTSAVVDTAWLGCRYRPSQDGMSLFYAVEVRNIMENYPEGTYEVSITPSIDGDNVNAIISAGSGESSTVTFGTLIGTYASEVTIDSSFARDYSRVVSSGPVKPFSSRIKSQRSASSCGYSVYSSAFVNDAEDDQCGTNGTYDLKWKCTSGSGSGSQAVSSVGDMIVDAAAKIGDLATTRWGPWNTPSSYAYVDDTEAAYVGEITEADYQPMVIYADGSTEDENDPAYCTLTAVVQDNQVSMSDLFLRRPSGSEKIIDGPIYLDREIMTVALWFKPDFRKTEDSPYVPPERKPHGAYADAYIFQRMDFDFKSVGSVE